MKDKIEKIEVQKGDNTFFYTVEEFVERDDGWIEIKTVFSEKYLFRREQIMQRYIVNTDSNEKRDLYIPQADGTFKK